MMGLWKVIAVLITLFGLSSGVIAVDRVEIMRIIESCYNLDPASGERIEAIIEKEPKHPLGHFLKGARLYWLQYYAGYDNSLSSEFEAAMKTSLKVARGYLDENEESEDALFYLGMIELNIARYNIDREKWFSGFLKARSGMKRLRRLLEMNPDYHDAKQPFALANCYLDDVPGFLKLFARLISFRGDYEAGLKQLYEMKEVGFYTRYESSMYIADVSWEIEKDAEKARTEMEWLAKKFPRNVFFHFNLAMLDRQLERDLEAVKRLEMLVEMPELDAFLELYVGSHLQLGHLLNVEGKSEKALQLAEIALGAVEGREEAKPLMSLALLLKGRVLRDLGRKEAALVVFGNIKRAPYPIVYKHAQDEIESLEGES